MCKLCLHPISFHPIRRSLRADGQVGLLKRSLHDGRRRENIGHSTRYKPSASLAYSLHIKEEADLEREPDSPLGRNRGSTPTELFKNESDVWNSKTYLGALLKLKTSTEAGQHLKDIPRLLEAAGLLTKTLAYEKGSLQEAACGDSGRSPSESPSFDLKIPQVRLLTSATDLSWEALPTGPLSENGLGKTLRSVLPRPTHKKSSVGFISSGSAKPFWPYDSDGAAGGGYPLDSLSDLGNKQPRKKRGRYRQYNTELLEEAIVVVLNGKMSVSKAQSVYGIPHSTLEYKVKERLGTLKNPPKKKPKLISQVEENNCGRSPEEKECQNSALAVSQAAESASEESESGIHSGISDEIQESLTTS